MTPGSEEAIKEGCICDPMNNHHGKGFTVPGKETIFWKHEDCPVHGVEAEMQKLMKEEETKNER